MTEALLKYTIFLDKGRGLKRIGYSFMSHKSTRGFGLGFALGHLLHTALATESLDNLMWGGGHIHSAS